LRRILLDTVNQPKIKKGTVINGRIIEISTLINLLNKMAIPVTPPSKKPLGSKKALRPILASKIAKARATISPAIDLKEDVANNNSL
jgi:ABC-type microcin C transport system permease subunit YejE